MSIEKNRKVYILLSDCEILGVWTNLKYLCDAHDDIRFPSYSKLSKDIAILRKEGTENPCIHFETKTKKYQIKVEIIKQNTSKAQLASTESQ